MTSPRSCRRPGSRRACVGLSLGAAVGMWLAARYPARVRSLSLHSAWNASDPFLRSVVESWRIMARGLDSVTEMVIAGIFPWCFTPELYAARPEYIDSLADFVRSRPMPPVDAFLRQSAPCSPRRLCRAGRIEAPTLITFGEHDMVTSTRFAGPLTEGIADSEVIVFANCRARADLRDHRGVQRAHAGLPAAPVRLGLARATYRGEALPSAPRRQVPRSARMDSRSEDVVASTADGS